MLYSSFILNNHTCCKKKSKYSRHFIDEKTTEHQVPKSIHIQHIKMQHRYVKNWKLPPVFLRAKNPSQTHEYSEVTQQSKKQNKGRRKDKKKKREKMNEARILHLDFKKISQDGKKPQNNKTIKPRKHTRCFFNLTQDLKLFMLFSPHSSILLTKNSCYSLFQFKHISST